MNILYRQIGFLQGIALFCRILAIVPCNRNPMNISICIISNNVQDCTFLFFAGYAL